jgi:hypothetical protein
MADKNNYKALELGTKNDDDKSVLISDIADRPNAFNSYSSSKLSAKELKELFDRPFLYIRLKFNSLLGILATRDEKVDKTLEEQGTTLAAHNEEIKRIAEKADSINNYDLTDDDKQEIAGIIVESLNGNDIAYTGEGVSEDG